MKTQTRLFRRGGVLVGSAALALSIATALPAAADTPERVALPSPNSALTTGTPQPLDPARQLDLRVYLAARPGLAAAAQAVSDPANPGYARFLTPAQAAQRYGTTAAQVAAVSTWLTGLGVKITATTPHYLAVTATVAQADAAFGTQVSEFDTTTTDPKTGTHTSRSPGVVGGFSVPAALAGDIVSVTGINQIDLGTTGADPTARPATTPLRQAHADPSATDFQCSQYWAQHTHAIPPAFGHTTAPTQLCGYTPDQIRQAYGLSSSPYTGKGTTIALVLDGHSSTELADSNRFFAAHGEPPFAPGQYTENIGPDVDSTCAALGDPNGDPMEESIDVQSAHLAAPDAHIVYVAVDCVRSAGDLLPNWLDGVSRVVDQHLADVASGSWGGWEPGWAPADMAPWDAILQQGALEGIGFDFSTGDSGDGGDVHNAQFPASDPWSTAVGGTSLAIGENGSVVADYAWGDNLTPLNAAGTGYDEAPPGTYLEGTGGGVSTMFREPGYQKAVVPTGLATSNDTAPAARVLPDISADAGNPWLVGATGMFEPGDGYEEFPQGGGTSASAPLIAGMEADAMQAIGHPLGFANPVLYQLAGSKALRDILPVDPTDPPIALGAQDITSVDPGRLTTFGEDETLTATRGYDDATGLGSPTPSFVRALGRH
ncbi:protease pro-enzyme activation domain-containing protein [Amycolatopsis sp. NPDC051903]|uniref:S53 family peptidase n=1 Tax=Amycolatopsis sp. NPDC051903 TaxID=3363936 RepID=UPI0037BCDE04